MYPHEVHTEIEQIFEFIETNNKAKVEFEGGEFTMLPARHPAGARMVIVNLGTIRIGYSGDTALYEPSLDRLFEECHVVIHEATSVEPVKGSHTNLLELLEIQIPKDTILYISHHDQTVVDWFSENDTNYPNMYLARDNDVINFDDTMYSIKGVKSQNKSTINDLRISS
jgi:ribonuclease BN (tRNA processing enzyme)